MADTAQRTGLKLRRTENSAGTEGSPSDIVKDKYLEPQLISQLLGQGEVIQYRSQVVCKLVYNVLGFEELRCTKYTLGRTTRVWGCEGWSQLYLDLATL